MSTTKKNHIIFFDLETNGIRPFYKSAIMQISLKCETISVRENIYVYPYDNIIGATEIHQIDEKTLISNNAIQSKDLITYLLETFHKKNDKYYFIAYNNFGFDQNVLEYHFKHYQNIVPQNWLFIDIMPYIQRYYPDIRKNGGYKLSNVYEILCKEEECEDSSEPNNKKRRIINFHNAFDDVYALSEIFKKVNPDKKKLGSYIRGSYTNQMILKSPISAIAGYAHFFNLEKHNINSIEDLYDQYKKVNKNDDLFKKYLKEKIGIYSEFYLNKIIEQFQILDNLITNSKSNL
jgi:DNA polymerase III epsilon subunit-like protein